MSGMDNIDFKFLAEQSVDVICLSGFDRLVRYISPSCYQLLGFTPDELIGKGPEAYILADDMPLLLPARERILASPTHSDVTTLRMKRKDGAIIWVEINVRLVRDTATGEPKEHVIVMRDVTENKKLLDRLTALALFDSLTNLSNRRAFDAVLEREWKRTVRSGTIGRISGLRQFRDLLSKMEGQLTKADRRRFREILLMAEQLEAGVPCYFCSARAVHAVRSGDSLVRLVCDHHDVDGNPISSGDLPIRLSARSAEMRQETDG